MAPGDGRIFISYRRQETAWPARQLYEALCERFGVSQVFKDVDNIAPGEDFVEKITSVVGSCRVLLAMIGPQWLHVADNDGNRRVDDPDDFVRLEVATALSRGVLVVPILVDGARMPKPTELPPDLAGLTRRQAVEISPTGFDLTRLFQALHAVLQEPDDPTVAGSPVPDSAGPPTDPAPESEPEPVVLEPPVPVVEESEPPPPTEPVVEPEPPVPEPEPVRVEPPEPVVEHAEPPPPDAVPEPMPAEPPPPREPVAEPPVPPPPPEPVTVTAAPAPRPARSRLPLVIGGAAVLVVAAGIAAFWPLGNQPAGPSPTAPTVTLAPSTTAPGPVSATVTVDRSVVPTGVSCTVGRVFSLTASGELTAGERTVGADGAAGWFDEAAPLADVPLDALIGRVGDERFFVGDTLTLVCPGDGELELGTNSPDDSGFDGSLTAEIRSRDDLSADDLGIVTVTLPATEAWLDSGFACATDATFRVSATGIAGAANASASARGGPDGVRLRDGEIVPGAALRTAAHRALLGRVDGGDPFLLGSSATLECPADGALELQVNDGVLEDNTGEFSVTLSRWPE